MTDPDIRKKIIEAATYLFGVEGYASTSTRSIALRAGVNIASLNYYFKSKKGLFDEVVKKIRDEFHQKIREISLEPGLDTSKFTLKIYQTMKADPSRLLNHFKLFLDSSLQCDEIEPAPVGIEKLGFFLEKELNPKVPEAERKWAGHAIFSYIMHTAVLSSTEVGKASVEKIVGTDEKALENYLIKLVETIIRDLNRSYP